MFVDGDWGNSTDETSEEDLMSLRQRRCVRGDMKSFGLCRKDPRHSEEWSLRIRGNQQTRVYLEMVIKTVCMCVYWCCCGRPSIMPWWTVGSAGDLSLSCCSHPELHHQATWGLWRYCLWCKVWRSNCSGAFHCSIHTTLLRLAIHELDVLQLCI